jgi:hypothetical protein
MTSPEKIIARILAIFFKYNKPIHKKIRTNPKIKNIAPKPSPITILYVPQIMPKSEIVKILLDILLISISLIFLPHSNNFVLSKNTSELHLDKDALLNMLFSSVFQVIQEGAFYPHRKLYPWQKKL